MLPQSCKGIFLIFVFLEADHLGVVAVLSHQGLVISPLDDPAIPQDQDLVGVADGGQAVGNRDGGLLTAHLVDAGGDHLLSVRIDAGGRLIQDQDPWVTGHHPGEGNQLALTS